MSEKMRGENYHNKLNELEAILNSELIDSMLLGVLKGKLMEWATRWAGRPSREQVGIALAKAGITPYSNGIGFLNAIDSICELYPTPAPERKRVRREDIIGFFGNYPERKIISAGYLIKDVNLLIDDLCRLLGIEEEKPRWCLEIKWNGTCWVNSCSLEDGVQWEKVDDRINFCFLCGKPRPATEGR